MASHDHSYKLLFSHPRMVRDLIVGFVRGRWRTQMDLRTLEKGNTQFVADNLRSRASDMIWRSRTAKNARVYLLLEFQSAVEPLMAVRVLTYVALLYQDLAKSGQIQRRRLPPILPIVLYRGDRRWTAPTSLGPLFRTSVSPPKGFRAQIRYQLIDVRRLRLDAPVLKRNLAAALFRIENSRSRGEIRENLRLLLAILKTSGTASLRRAFTIWINRVVLARLGTRQVGKVISLEEMHNVLSDRFTEWEAELRAIGRREGLREGKAELLLGQLRARFGHEPPQWARRQVHRATSAQLTRWGERLFSVKTLHNLLRPGRRTSSRTKCRARG